MEHEKILEIMNNHGFLMSLDKTGTRQIWEQTPRADIGKAKNALHEQGLFLRVFKEHSIVEPKCQLHDEELSDIVAWAQAMGYHVTKEGESHAIRHGWKKMYLYIEEKPVRGKLQRMVMAEYLNRHENISDLITMWQLMNGIKTVKEYVSGSILGFTAKPIEFCYG